MFLFTHGISRPSFVAAREHLPRLVVTFIASLFACQSAAARGHALARRQHGDHPHSMALLSPVKEPKYSHAHGLRKQAQNLDG